MAKQQAKCPRCGRRFDYDSADERIVCAGCGTALRLPGNRKPADPADPLIGQSLGEFEIVQLLGRGGMGAVYKARQASLDRFVAVKVLPDHAFPPAGFGARGRLEGTAETEYPPAGAEARGRMPE